MTAQVPETLILDGKPHDMCTEPLEAYLNLMEIEEPFIEPHTACWRGYFGTWEIVEDRLYLIRLEGDLHQGGRAGLETFFPGFPERVFAHWFTGTLRVPQGKLLEYVHGGYGSEYESDLLIEVECGVVKSQHVKHNGLSADPDALEGYVLGGFTTLGGY